MSGKAVRVRGIRPELWPDLADDVRARQAASLKALPPVQLLEVGGGALVMAEVWRASDTARNDVNAIDSLDTSRPTSKLPPDVEDLLAETLSRSRSLATAMTELHESGHVWFEFDPQAVELSGSQLRITNLDWRLFPNGRCPSVMARVSPKFSPPEVCQFRDDSIGPRTDVYHLALAAYY